MVVFKYIAQLYISGDAIAVHEARNHRNFANYSRCSRLAGRAVCRLRASAEYTRSPPVPRAPGRVPPWEQDFEEGEG